MFTAKHIKDGKMLIKGVTKFIHYKRDILSEEKLDAIRKKQTAFKELLRTGTKEEVREKAKELQKVCERSLPMPTMPGVRENVEVFFVAIVIALGIRSYFLQPFKIPTGSMQPTLNGIIAQGYSEQEETKWKEVEPNILVKGWDLLWRGRNYVDVTAKEDFTISKIYQKNWLKFFSFTYIERRGIRGEKLKPIRIWSPILQTVNDLGLRNHLSGARQGKAADGTPVFSVNGAGIKAGTVLARGYVDTGDQVLVNKFSYHFRKPTRGEVFVFTTQGIELIEERNGNTNSQHYIKRLVGVPGDRFEVKPPELHINGVRATESGINRVMEQQDGYTGYVLSPRKMSSKRESFGMNSGKLPPREYMAMGDNSPNSWDSRGWGTVKEKNLVGPALFVYWPFGAHWGLID
ncbi:MAG: signal peptidase I [Verrucomicrobiaceae bacterium]|nr:signal peptidase I [Verrucomicrobiaceae bacterium]NCF93248.1 signal peptidase I [Verrucomicrobiaceae bacterium]